MLNFLINMTLFSSTYKGAEVGHEWTGLRQSPDAYEFMHHDLLSPAIGDEEPLSCQSGQ